MQPAELDEAVFNLVVASPTGVAIASVAAQLALPRGDVEVAIAASERLFCQHGVVTASTAQPILQRRRHRKVEGVKIEELIEESVEKIQLQRARDDIESLVHPAAEVA